MKLILAGSWFLALLTGSKRDGEVIPANGAIVGARNRGGREAIECFLVFRILSAFVANVACVW